MYQAVFQLDRRGEVQVNLPSDITLDENVSGSVIYSGGLSQIELVIEDKNINLHGGGNFTYKLPGNVSTGVVKVTLRYSNGIEIGKAFFPVSIGKLREPSVIPDDKNFKLPYFGNSGMPLSVKGVFDGNYTNTLITLAEQRLRILAESTTSCVFVTTNSVSGEGVLKISELGKQEETKFTNLAVVKIEDRQPPRQSGFNYSNENQTGERVVSGESRENPDFSQIPQHELHVDIPGEAGKNISAENKMPNIERKSSVSRSSEVSTNSAFRSAPSYSELESEIDKHFTSEFYPVNRAMVNYADDNTLLSEKDYDGLTGKSGKADKQQDSDMENNSGDERQLVAKSIKSRDTTEEKVEEKIPVTEKKAAEPQKVNVEQEKSVEKENVPGNTPDKVTAITSEAEQEKEKSVEEKKAVKTEADENKKPEKVSDKKKKTDETASLKKEGPLKKPAVEIASEKEKVNKTKNQELQDETRREKKDFAEPPENTLPDDGNIMDIIRPLPDTGDSEIASIAESLKNDPGENDAAEFEKDKNSYCIQLASFKRESEIEGFVARMKKLNYKEDVKKVDLNDRGQWHRVRICEFNTRKEAETFLSGIDKKKLNVSDIYVTKY